MESLNKIITSIHQNNQIGGLKSENEEKYCKECGQPLFKVVTLQFDTSKQFSVPVICKCISELKRLEEAQQKNIERQEKLKSIYTNSLMDSKLKECTFDNWNHNIGNEELFKIVENYARNFEKIKQKSLGLYIFGNTGNGKTFAASCIANYLMQRFIPVINISSISFYDRIKQTFNSKNDHSESSVILNLDNADLLIIDDLGSETKSDWSKSILYQVIDRRIRIGLPIIVTSNYNSLTLNQVYGERIGERIIDQACTTLENSWPSLRKAEGNNKFQLLSEIINV